MIECLQKNKKCGEVDDGNHTQTITGLIFFGQSSWRLPVKRFSGEMRYCHAQS